MFKSVQFTQVLQNVDHPKTIFGPTDPKLYIIRAFLHQTIYPKLFKLFFMALKIPDTLYDYDFNDGSNKLRKGAIFISVSSHSRLGSEALTMPAPANNLIC